MRLSDLARIEQVKRPTMTKLVAGLERDGLAKRRPDGTDARAYHVQATPRGTTLLHQGRKRRVARLAAVLKDLPAKEIGVIFRAAQIIERVVPEI
jgi:DNA-binding MarR family transcriptional regulator